MEHLNQMATSELYKKKNTSSKLSDSEDVDQTYFNMSAKQSTKFLASLTQKPSSVKFKSINNSV